MVCSGRGLSTAYCDRCDFNHSVYHCSSYLLPDVSTSNDTAECVQGPVTVYTGNQLSFTGLHYPLIYIAPQRYTTKRDSSSAIPAAGTSNSSPSTVTVSWQHTCTNKMTHKPENWVILTQFLVYTQSPSVILLLSLIIIIIIIIIIIMTLIIAQIRRKCANTCQRQTVMFTVCC